MVRKTNKAGLHTGNTIRLASGHPFLKKFQTYGYFVTEGHQLDRSLRKSLKNLLDVLPSYDGRVEYSMNKKKRWDLPRALSSTLLQQSDNPDLFMSIKKHTSRIGQAEGEHKRFCTSYQANQGAVLEKTSHSEMNMKSAMQAYLESDHMTKKERRQFIKQAAISPPVSCSSPHDSADDNVAEYSCHIIHGAAANGRMYKDLQTKGILITRSSTSKRHTGSTGSSKPQRSQLLMIDECDFEYDYESDDTTCMEESIAPRHSPPMTVSMADLLAQSKRKKLRLR